MLRVKENIRIALPMALLVVALSRIANAQQVEPLKWLDGKPLVSPGAVSVKLDQWDGTHGLSTSGLQITNLPVVAVHPVETRSATPAAIAKNNSDPCDTTGRPILPQTGRKVETYPLFALPGEMGLKFVLYYNTSSNPEWTSNIDYWLDTDCSTRAESGPPCKQTIAHRPDGSTFIFSGGPTATAYSETSENGQYIADPISTLTRDTTTGEYTLHDEDALTEIFGRPVFCFQFWTLPVLAGT